MVPLLIWCVWAGIRSPEMVIRCVTETALLCFSCQQGSCSQTCTGTLSHSVNSRTQSLHLVCRKEAPHGGAVAAFSARVLTALSDVRDVLMNRTAVM